MPGSARMNPLTTRRSRGAMETTRSSRRMRSVRSTDREPVAGASAIPMTMATNQFQGSRKNRLPYA